MIVDDFGSELTAQHAHPRLPSRAEVNGRRSLHERESR